MGDISHYLSHLLLFTTISIIILATYNIIIHNAIIHNTTYCILYINTNNVNNKDINTNNVNITIVKDNTIINIIITLYHVNLYKAGFLDARQHNKAYACNGDKACACREVDNDTIDNCLNDTITTTIRKDNHNDEHYDYNDADNIGNTIVNDNYYG